MPKFDLPRQLSRRAALRLSAGALLATATAATTVSCSTADEDAEAVDSLTMHLAYARRDADTALALAAVVPDLAGALDVVRIERSAHANALEAEMNRLAGEPEAAETPAPGESTEESAESTAPPPPPPTLDELKADLAEAQRSAADSARNESGYRAGLLGSISAACAVELGSVLA